VANLIAFALAGALRFVVAWVIERLVLRHLVNQEGTTLLMATLGISYFLDGIGQTIFGSDIYKIDVGMPKEPIMAFEQMFEGGILINKEDLYAALIAAVLVAALSIFFQKTATGRALRAVADDHQAAQSIGIPLNRIWVIVWCVAGVVALVAGMIWGSKLGVQFSLTTVALRALPGGVAGGGFGRVHSGGQGPWWGVGSSASVKSCPRCSWGRMSVAASRSGLPMCWRCCSCWSGLRACLARRSLIVSDLQRIE